MTTIEQDGLAEKARAEELLATVPLLEEVDSVTVRVDEDWSGEPALYLTFRLRPQSNPDTAFYKRFTEYSNRVQRKILDSGISRFPYVRLRNAA